MTEVHVLHQSDGSEDSASATSGSEQGRNNMEDVSFLDTPQYSEKVIWYELTVVFTVNVLTFYHCLQIGLNNHFYYM